MPKISEVFIKTFNLRSPRHDRQLMQDPKRKCSDELQDCKKFKPTIRQLIPQHDLVLFPHSDILQALHQLEDIKISQKIQI